MASLSEVERTTVDIENTEGGFTYALSKKFPTCRVGKALDNPAQRIEGQLYALGNWHLEPQVPSEPGGYEVRKIGSRQLSHEGLASQYSDSITSPLCHPLLCRRCYLISKKPRRVRRESGDQQSSAPCLQPQSMSSASPHLEPASTC